MTITRSNIPSGMYPLSSAQSRIWFMENLNEGMRAYNDPYDYKISGKVDIDALNRSINVLIKRHESFRTVFRNDNGNIHQLVLPELKYDLEVVSLEKEPEEKIRELIAHHSLENSQYKFDLRNGPLFYFKLLVLGKDQYIFLLNFHHIISDAVSIRIFLDELVEVYRSQVENKPPDLPEIPLSYKDYAVWENQWIEGSECQRQVDYWKNELSGIPDMLQLPLDKNRPKIQQFRGAEYRFDIDENLKSRLSVLSKKHSTSLIMPALTAFGILMSKYSLQDDLVVGVPVANRSQEELQQLIGVLINSLPLRMKFDQSGTFSEHMKAFNRKFMESYENQAVPFERLVEELKIKRSLNNSPVFQVLFNYLSLFDEEIKAPGMTLRLVPGERKVAMVDLTFTIHDYKKDAVCVIQYDTDIFRPETIEKMAGHYLTILKTITENENMRIGEIPLLTPSERDQILVKWNETTAVYPKEKCTHNLFEEQVLRTPDNTAVQDDRSSLTYNELNIRANKLASMLVKKGAEEGKYIALFVERGIDMLVGLLAIVKSGASFLPLDPIYPLPRLEIILNDAKPVLFITQTKFEKNLPATEAGIVFIDDYPGYENEPGENLGKGNSQLPAYILYTSGSTGRPKGVKVLHHSVVNLVLCMKRLLNATESDILLAVTTISFDIAELEMYLPLFSGGKLVIASQETAMDTSLLIEKIESAGTTLFQATPVTYKMLLMKNWKGKNDLKVIAGGEAFSKELARDLRERCKEVWNGYGPTETSIYSVVQNLMASDTEGEGFCPIGRPVDNTRVYVLNSYMVPLPVGIPGELCIGGTGVSPGYLNLPELTEQKFIADNFSGIPGSRLYRTGDIVKYYPDGRLVFLNRVDTQVKIRGFRIELGEIESVLSQFKGIKECVVALKEDAGGEKILVGYYIASDKNAIDQSEVKQFVRQKLPDYMVPAVIVQMEVFPLTANNKIDRKLLPEPDFSQNIKEFVAPATPTEVRLAKIWQSIFKVDRISVLEDFFEAGGHSMIAVTLIIKIEKEFGIRLPLASLFEKSTIRAMSEIIDQGANKISEKWRSLVPIRPEGSLKPIFLVHGLGLNVLLYTTLVTHLDPEQPVYGLQAKGMNGTEAPLTSIEEIAGHYISEIMSVEKEGPYFMAGFSLGGKIAYEMARQLTEMGKEVGFLGLFDTVADGPSEDEDAIGRYLNKANYAFNYIAWNIRSLFFKSEGDSMKVLKRKLKGLERKLKGIDLNVAKEMQSQGTENELPDYVTQIHRANKTANRKYVIKPYQGTVHLFKAKNQTFFIENTDTYGWDKYALNGVIIHEIPGEHSSIFAPPNDAYFAEILQGYLHSITALQKQ